MELMCLGPDYLGGVEILTLELVNTFCLRGLLWGFNKFNIRKHLEHILLHGICLPYIFIYTYINLIYFTTIITNIIFTMRSLKERK